VHGPRQRFHQFRGGRAWLRLAVELLAQRAPVHKFQREPGQAILFAHFIDLDQVGVVQASNRLRLGAEAGPFLGCGLGAGLDHL
jgi:hypothetical protein